MRVSDILKSNRQTLATCIPDNSIGSICTLLSSLNVGALPVCDAHGTLVGIISERDVVRAFAKDGARLADRHVRDLMTREEADAQAPRSPYTGYGRSQARWHAFDPGHYGVAVAGVARRGQRAPRHDDRRPEPLTHATAAPQNVTDLGRPCHSSGGPSDHLATKAVNTHLGRNFRFASI
jgi:hypothetical protein